MIRDQGDAAADRIDLWGFAGPSYAGAPVASRMSLDRVGDDAVLIFDGGAMSITLSGQCRASGANVIETVSFFSGYWKPWTMQLRSVERDLVGDERPQGTGNEIIFGSDRADRIYTDAGLNLVWLGAGADVLIYKASDPSTAGQSSGGGTVSDVIIDFNVAEDHMDFRDIRGLTLDDLQLGSTANGDATVGWVSGRPDISDIVIELRGVTMGEVTADLFLFG